MHANSFDACRSFVAGLRASGKPLQVADVGSYDVNGTYRQLFDGWTYIGFDIKPGPNVDVAVSPDRWDLPEQYREAFDIVLSGQTMEHVAAPWRWIHDVSGLLKPGGVLWLAVPNEEVFHEYPIDAWRCWPDGMKAIFAEAGLSVVDCYASGPDTFGIARKP